MTDPGPEVKDNTELAHFIAGSIVEGRFASFQEYAYGFKQKESGFDINRQKYSWMGQFGLQILSALNFPEKVKLGQLGIKDGEMFVIALTNEKDDEGQNYFRIAGIVQKSHIDDTGRVGRIAFDLDMINERAAETFLKNLEEDPFGVLQPLMRIILKGKLPYKSRAQVVAEKNEKGEVGGRWETANPFELPPENWVIGRLSNENPNEPDYTTLVRKSFSRDAEPKTEKFQYSEKGEWTAAS